MWLKNNTNSKNVTSGTAKDCICRFTCIFPSSIRTMILAAHNRITSLYGLIVLILVPAG